MLNLSQKHSRLTWSWVFILCIYSNETLNFPWRHLTRPPPLANRRLIQVLHCITTKPELVYQIYGILLTFFPFIPSYLPFVFILLMFSRQRKSCNHFFLDYISSINLFSFNKAINNSVLRCVTYSSGAVEVHTIYQLWSNKNSLVCL